MCFWSYLNIDDATILHRHDETVCYHCQNNLKLIIHFFGEKKSLRKKRETHTVLIEKKMKGTLPWKLTRFVHVLLIQTLGHSQELFLFC